MEEGLDWKVVLVGGAVFLIALAMIMPAITGGSGVEIPAVGGGGKAVADLSVTVSGIWQHYSIPYWTDSVKIDKVDYVVKNWRRVLFSFGTLSTADTGDGKIVWELYDDAGNKVRWGEQQFGLTSGWSVTFTIRGIEPGNYQLKVTVYQYWDAGILGGKGWDARDSRTVSVVINQPSNI